MISGRTRLTVYSAVATLLVACSLLPLVEGKAWLVQATLLVAVQALAGALARRMSLPRPVIVAAQFVVVLVLLTALFAPGGALLGVVPSPSSLSGLSRLLSSGVRDVVEFAIPAPVTDGIALLLVGGVAVVAVLADATAVTYRSAASAGLPMLALYSVASGLAKEEETRWLWFLLAAAGYLLLLLASGQDRLARWGKVFAPARGNGPYPGFPPGRRRSATTRAGHRIGVVVLGVALIIPAALPSLEPGLVGGGGAGGADGGVFDGGVAVQPWVSLQDSLKTPVDREVLRYRTDSDQTSDLYLRIVALDEFDGVTWRPSRTGAHTSGIPDPLPQPAGLTGATPVTQITTTVSAAGWYRQKWLPMPYPAISVRVDGAWSFKAADQTVVAGPEQTTSGAEYQVTSLLVEPTARQLAEAPAADQRLVRQYTRVPESLPDVVADTALDVTRGADSQYQRAVLLQDWFASSGEFRYSTDVQVGTGPSAITRFLKDKEGFCVHFAFTMAAMARTLGIPARVAVGFVPGTPNPNGTWSVGLKDAHAWPELYFEGAGWIRFEPTPTRGSTPDYAIDRARAPGVPEPSRSGPGTALPTPGESQPATCDPAARRGDDCDQGKETGGGGSGGDGFRRTLVAGGALVLLAALIVPALGRAGARRRRLRGDAPATARTLAAWREMIDSAWDLGLAPHAQETPRQAAARIVRDGGLPEPAARSAQRVAAAVEEVLYAAHPPATLPLADDVRRVRAALAAGTTRRVRLRATLLPASGARVAWRVAAFRGRWAARLRSGLAWSRRARAAR